MDKLGNITVVTHIDSNSLAFLHAQQRSGRTAVVTYGLNDLLWCKLELDGSNPQ